MNTLEITGISSKVINEENAFFLVIRPKNEKTNKYSNDEIKLLVKNDFIKRDIASKFVKGYKLYVKGELTLYKGNTYPLVTFVELFDHELREEVATEYRRVKKDIPIPIVGIK